MQTYLAYYGHHYKNITRVYTIGQSVQGRNLTAIEISARPGRHEPGEPEFKYVGNMHGNELAGRQVLIALAEYLVHNYGVDDRVTRLLNTTEVMSPPSIILLRRSVR